MAENGQKRVKIAKHVRNTETSKKAQIFLPQPPTREQYAAAAAASYAAEGALEQLVHGEAARVEETERARNS